MTMATSTCPKTDEIATFLEDGAEMQVAVDISIKNIKTITIRNSEFSFTAFLAIDLPFETHIRFKFTSPEK
ncbi:MAG: hypothetical protein CVV64_02015 [Candidatus Wallbacteria bacterium HGW-Wallbacteria-1]|jgi:hypothetical protein|uniref:Uncharacterized protein n=1 Tax=Candidatus Wallbacteria bacterium HGW-Wallbacteria-1 TaxID=2013854 RepID=A0A2N1PV40_9BACT|nr:MAG: hypothetical protein CVV64_02015 [Candidatus Wallbacteria bacterium HGW-Wallbacteria-1]